jgi:hypothetical protein
VARRVLMEGIVIGVVVMTRDRRAAVLSVRGFVC